MPARHLPARPNLEQYRKRAKDLLKQWRHADNEALRRLREHHPHPPATPMLADAQLVVAREHGVESWPKFVKAIEAASGRLSSASVWRTAEEAVVAGDATTLEALLLDYGDVFRNERPKSWWNNTLHPNYEAGNARAIISRTHHFDTWEDFEAFTRAMHDGAPTIVRFEAAADAIVAGNIESLRRLVDDHPELIGASSARNHHATLLHYVGANGIEGWRQHTPANAVEVLQLLIESGAEVDAVADMYGGSTTLGLVATSLHPERAGLQEALMDVLIAHGARIDIPGVAGRAHPLVNACLANGRPRAATYLASRGAPLDVEAAGGLGRVDLLAAYFDEQGRPRSSTTPQQLASALVAAAEHNQQDAVRFLLDRGVPVDAQAPGSAFTGANWAALNGNVDLLKLFIARGARLEIENDYGGAALDASLWGAANRPRQDLYPEVVETLIAAGAKVEPGFADWWAKQEPRSPQAHMRILGQLRGAERSA
jgi:ankyrin repeat protein